MCVDHNLAIVLPSKQIKERFRGYKKIDSPEPVDVEIRDLDDQQGILLRGEPNQLNSVLRLTWENFFDAICWERKYGDVDFVEIEFPFKGETHNRIEGFPAGSSSAINAVDGSPFYMLGIVNERARH